jgi:hypothetical protein
METYEGIQNAIGKTDLEYVSDFVRLAIEGELSALDSPKIDVGVNAGNVAFGHFVNPIETREIESPEYDYARLIHDLPGILTYFQAEIKRLKKRVKVLEKTQPVIVIAQEEE